MRTAIGSQELAAMLLDGAQQHLLRPIEAFGCTANGASLSVFEERGQHLERVAALAAKSDGDVATHVRAGQEDAPTRLRDTLQRFE
jgi:hypothetical protein